MFWFILIIFLLFVILLMFSHLSIEITLFVQEKNKMIRLQIYLYKMCVFKRKKSFLTKDDNDIWTFLENVDKDTIKNTRKVFSDIRYLYWMLTLFLHKLKVYKINWQTTIGSQEAMSTGLYVGTMWMVKGLFIGLFSKQSQLKCKPQTSITPYFQKQVFQSELNCIVSIRTGQAIHIFMKLLTNKDIDEMLRRL